MIFVANLRSFRPAEHPNAKIVYVGRRMPNRPGSPLANVFHVSEDTPRARLACLARYWRALEGQPRTSPAWQELRRLAAIARERDLVLCCWCAPAACHADVIKWQLETINRSSLFWRVYDRSDEAARLELDERVAILELEGGLPPWIAERRALELVSPDLAR